MKVVISIKYGWNIIVWAKIRHLRHFAQNLLGVKVHASCKILNFCWHFWVTKTHIVSAWVLIPLSKSNPSIFFLSPQTLKDLISSPRQTKSSDNPNVSHMFNNNTNTDFKTAYKHILIPSYIKWFKRTKKAQN